MKRLLGVDSNVPESIKGILQQATRQAYNVRQCMSRVRGAFGEGVDLEFPEEVQEEVPGKPNAYGDGSLKKTCSGGMGLWRIRLVVARRGCRRGLLEYSATEAGSLRGTDSARSRAVELSP